MTKLRDLADRMRRRSDGYRRDTFALPRDVARAKAREMLDRYPKAAYGTMVRRGVNCPTAALNSPCAGCRQRIDRRSAIPRRTGFGLVSRGVARYADRERSSAMSSKSDSSKSGSTDPLRYPWEAHPGPDQVVEVMPGVLWLRLKLPFPLNHVNIYLLADGDGWAIIDTGFGNDDTIAAWTKLFEGPLKGFKISRVIVTHAHPDHIGQAGWLIERFGCPFHITQIEYLQGVYHRNRRTEERIINSRQFFQRHGMTEDVTDQLLGRGQDYLKKTAPLPAAFTRLANGQHIQIGARSFQVITGAGHSSDQAMFYCAADKLFLSADQVLSKISPNVSVWAHEPDENSLGAYLASLKSIADALPDDVLVLPGHGVPFYGLHARVKQLSDHHQERCQLIAAACRDQSKTSAQLVPVVFYKHVLDAHQTGFAAGELIAHVNYMLSQNRLTQTLDANGVLQFWAT